VEVAIRVRVSLRLRLASLLLCSALPRSPPRLAGSGLAGRPPTFGLSCFPCQLPPLGLVRHWPLAGFRKAETHKTTRGQSALFRVQAQPTRSLFDCLVWTVEEVYASERSSSRGPALQEPVWHGWYLLSFGVKCFLKRRLCVTRPRSRPFDGTMSFPVTSPEEQNVEEPDSVISMV
jgi:hypothetical protein